MNCPHGKKIHVTSHYGVSLYSHEVGGDCRLMNQLDTACDDLADAYITEFIGGHNIHDIGSDSHLTRIAYSAYKVSVLSRFRYMEFLSNQSPDAFAKGFDPIYYALISEDDYATNGLYLLELYFAFCGITERISAVNSEVTQSPLYRFLSDRALRSTVVETADTRSYAHTLKLECARYKDAFTIPIRPHEHRRA